MAKVRRKGKQERKRVSTVKKNNDRKVLLANGWKKYISLLFFKNA